jgi:hypothetical protein
MGFGGMTSAVFVAGAVLGGADAFYASAPSDPAADLIARLGIHPASLEVLDQFGDDSFQVRVRYGAPWTAEQLADWYPPGDVMLTIVAGVLNVSDGGVQVREAIWRVAIAASRVAFAFRQGYGARTNVYTNLPATRAGDPYNPSPAIGHVWTPGGPNWVHDGSWVGHDWATVPLPGVWYDYTLDVTDGGAAVSCSFDGLVQELVEPCALDPRGRIAIGAYGGPSEIGEIEIVGWVTLPPAGTVWIESWDEDLEFFVSGVGDLYVDGVLTTGHEVRAWGSAAVRLTAVSGEIEVLNLGFDGADGGLPNPDLDLLATQHVAAVEGLRGVPSLRAFSALGGAADNLRWLDFGGLDQLEVVECYQQRCLWSVDLSGNTALRRLCLEDGNLGALDLTDCAVLEDLRGALNHFGAVGWYPAPNPAQWHVCLRDNLQMAPWGQEAIGLWPGVEELWAWNANLSGDLVIVTDGAAHGSGLILMIGANPGVTSVDISGVVFPRFLDVHDCGLDSAAVDLFLQQAAARVAAGALYSGQIDLRGNAARTSASDAAMAVLIAAYTWTVLTT